MSTIGRDILFIKPSDGNPRNSEGSFIRLHDGAIMFAYSKYCGTSWHDDASADIYAIISRDEGETWGEGRTILKKNPSDFNIMSTSFLRMANGDIGLFYLRKIESGDCLLEVIRSSDEGKTWSDPVRCMQSPGYYVTNNDRVIRLKNGNILAPGNLHTMKEEKNHSLNSTGRVFISTDDGCTFREAKEYMELPFESKTTGLQETGLIELEDNRIWAWARTDYGFQFESFSEDGGETWSKVRPNPYFTSPCSPLSVRRLTNGDLFAVFNPIPKYNGREIYNSWGRTPLVCAVSTTNDLEFGEYKIIEDDPRYGYCYTAIFPTDEYVLLAYCCGHEGHAPLEGLKIKKISVDEIL